MHHHRLAYTKTVTSKQEDKQTKIFRVAGQVKTQTYINIKKSPPPLASRSNQLMPNFFFPTWKVQKLLSFIIAAKQVFGTLLLLSVLPCLCLKSAGRQQTQHVLAKRTKANFLRTVQTGVCDNLCLKHQLDNEQWPFWCKLLLLIFTYISLCKQNVKL